MWETGTITNSVTVKLRIIQRDMERRIIEVRLRDRIWIEVSRENIQVTVICLIIIGQHESIIQDHKKLKELWKNLKINWGKNYTKYKTFRK